MQHFSKKNMTFQLNKSFFKGATIQGFHGGETNVPRDPADCASWGHGSVALTVKVGFFDEPPPLREDIGSTFPPAKLKNGWNPPKAWFWRNGISWQLWRFLDVIPQAFNGLQSNYQPIKSPTANGRIP